MPRKSVRQHGTQADQQTSVYKEVSNYKQLIFVNDNYSYLIQDIYQNNRWNLQEKFNELKEYYEQININPVIAWEQGVQYLDLPQPIPLNSYGLEAFKKGDYKNIAVDKKANSISTERTYAKRIEFWAKNFQSFNQFQGQDNFSWVLTYNRLLTYEIMKYNNDKGNTISSLNNDFKTIIRAIKLLLPKSDNELRWKFTSLQMAIGDIERYEDDLNQIKTDRELRTFIPYEQLLDIVDSLENQYNTSKDLKTNMYLLAVAINVLDYPSRMDKYGMEILTDISQIDVNKSYVYLTNPITFIFFNEKKQHKPLSYRLNAKPILEFNKRLNKIILQSISDFPRTHLFISPSSLKPVKDTTIAEWLKNLFPDKNLGVNTFRSSFVSYFYPKSNNREKDIMRIRMRTSRQELERAYFKQYTSPDVLVKVKLEPTDELFESVSTGTTTNPLMVSEEFDNDYRRVRPYSNSPQVNVDVPRQSRKKNDVSIREQRIANSRKYYADKREQHLEKMRKYDKDPQVKRRKYLRDLNSGQLDWSKMKETTKQKYNLKYDSNTNSYS